MIETKKAEELEKGDEIVLWAGPALGEVYVTVDRIYIYEEPCTVGITTEEIEWAELVAPIGTEIVLAED